MKHSNAHRIVLFALVGVFAVLATGCGGGAGTDTGATGGQTEPAPPGTTAGAGGGASIKVGLVTDIGGLNDRSFNALANEGLQQAQDELGIENRVLVSRSNQDYVPNLSSLAKQNYDLVIAVGFLMADAVAVVAPRFPDTKFAIVDFSQAGLKGKPMNVRGLLFKEQEAGYVVGYLAGLINARESGSRQVISSVGGLKIPPVDHYIAGFQAGANEANPNITTLNGYSQDFVDQAKCKEVALDQIAQGSDIVFQVAGGCGLGALDAAREKNLWGIGVDADQSYLGDHILTSALKKVDVAVFQTIQSAQDGSFQGGEDSVFDIASGAVGIGKISDKVPADIASKVQQVQEDVAAGRVASIPDVLK